jgi:alkylglycerol monooxygenase
MLNAAVLLIPIFLLAVGLEWYISFKKQDFKYSTGNVSMNITIGAIDQVGSLFYFALLFVVLEFVYTHYRIIEITHAWYQWVVGYIAVDFLSYWFHRLSHRVNILWAGHVTHHSSELFNLSNGFRTSVFQGINRILFWAILPVFGFHPLALVVILKVSGIYDFLLHTEYIPKLGFLEKFLVTPSSHRVHHGKNDIYIDKNYGSTFIIWDKLFGTFQEETVPVKYGITAAYTDNNPLTAIGHHYYYLWNTAKAMPAWKQKIKLLLMPPEWKPAVVNIKKETLRKTSVPVNQRLKLYAIFQVVGGVTGVFVMLVYKNFLSVSEILMYSTLGISILINTSLIFTENIHSSFAKREKARLIIALFFAMAMLLVYAQFYIWYIIAFLLACLIINVVYIHGRQDGK